VLTHKSDSQKPENSHNMPPRVASTSSFQNNSRDPKTNPTTVSKHGTLNEKDVEDVAEVNLDLLLKARLSESPSHLFGNTGNLPPKEVVVERRYIKTWSIVNENGVDQYVGLNKGNSNSKGRFEVSDLVPGEYKLVVKLLKTPNNLLLDIASAPIGAIIGGVSSLVSSSEDHAMRGNPAETVECLALVSTPKYVIAEKNIEIDHINDTVTMMFVVREIDSKCTLNLSFISHSLVKRLRVAADLFRYDLPPPLPPSTKPRPATPRFFPTPSEKEKAFKVEQGRDLMQRAFSSGDEKRIIVPQPPTKKTNARVKRCVSINSSLPFEKILSDFYYIHAPEKVAEVPKIISFFQNRDKNLGTLFATLEDKYGVKFNYEGEWK
jgi:hypothetical protein